MPNNLLPVLEEHEIEKRVGERTLRRGREYFQRGAIYNTRRQASILKASCTGSGTTAYRVEVGLTEHGIVNAGCTCPVGMGGTCKHVAAVLLCWRERPEIFATVDDLETSLRRCSRGELMRLVHHVVLRRPELEEMIETMLPSAGVPYTSPSMETYETQVTSLLNRGASDPDSLGRLVDQLRAIRDIGDSFQRQSEYGSAAVVYRGILYGFFPYAVQVEEVPAPLDAMIGTCVEALGVCLMELRDDPDERMPILRALVDFYHFELVSRQAVRHDVSDRVREHANLREKETVAGWLEALITASSSAASRRALGGWLLELRGDAMDEDTFIRFCRQTGRILELVQRLVQLGRLDEAIDKAELADNYDLLRAADLLVRHRYWDQAVKLVEARYEKTGDASLKEWLDNCRTVRQNQFTALKHTEEIFRLRPTFESYGRLRKAARFLGTWDTLHDGLLTFLENLGFRTLLIRIHLDENDVDRALELVNAEREAGHFGEMALEVARALEQSRPREALEIYRTHVEELLARRGQEDLIEADLYLRKIAALTKRTSGQQNWTSYLLALRSQYASYPPVATYLERLKV
jgi:uncharacterized Zn finger protein